MPLNRVAPDQDPHLRAALALDGDAQQAMLRAMAGETAVPAPNTRFRHVGVVTRTHPGGCLSCLPPMFPPESVMSGDSTTLQIRVLHTAFWRRQQPRSPAAVAALTALIEAHAPRIGVREVPFTRPRDWTLQSLRDAFGLMQRQLPETSDLGVAPLRIDSRPTVTILRFELPTEQGEEYFAEVHVAASALAHLALKASWRGTFSALDKEIAQKAPAPTSAATMAPKVPMGDFTHPTEQPDAEEMLSALARHTSDRGYGVSGFQGAKAFALRLETDLYNAWVRVQCETRGLRSPGALDEAQFSERFWTGGK